MRSELAASKVSPVQVLALNASSPGPGMTLTVPGEGGEGYPSASNHWASAGVQPPASRTPASTCSVLGGPAVTS